MRKPTIYMATASVQPKTRTTATADRRRKLDDDDKASIRDLRSVKGWSLGRIAKLYSVSVQAVRMVLDPTIYARNQARFRERGGHYALYGRAFNQRYHALKRRERAELAARAARDNEDKNEDNKEAQA